jgi:CBS-domain-containing membrane protein
MRILDIKLKHNVWRYIFQSSLAAFTILCVLIFLEVLKHTAIIASLGATLFIVFTSPRAYSSHPRPLIGGYLVGIASGLLCDLISESLLMLNIFPNKEISYIIFGALAAGVAILIMTITDTEHPPAAGIALGLVLNEWDYKTLIFILSAVILLFIVKSLLKKVLVDIR